MKNVRLLNKSHRLQPLFILLPLVLICFAFSENNQAITTSKNTRTDTVPVKDLNTVNWDNLSRLVPLHGALLAEVNKELYLISRKDYEAYARQKGKVSDNSLNEIFTRVEIEPEYPGGAEAWALYIKNNMQSSREAGNKNRGGTVIVQFIVDQEGNLHDVESISGPTGGGLRDAAIKLVKESGTWHPAIQNTRIVKAYKKQAVHF